MQRIAVWALCASFPILQPKFPRKAKGLRPGHGGQLIAWVALSNVPLVGSPLAGLAFRVLAK